MDAWKPGQYNRFKSERAQPFHDLLSLIETTEVQSCIDLGCGTGELTKILHEALPETAETVGIDASPSMLGEASRLSTERLKFLAHDIETFRPARTFDLVFSNAALQWLPDHRSLLPQIFTLVSERGQIAVQVPANSDHASHRIAEALALEMTNLQPKLKPVLPVEEYADLLERAGFSRQQCRLEVYMHRMASGNDVVEWTKGTMLTAYQKQLDPNAFEEFVSEYRRRLLTEIGEGPYAYPFKRILFYGRRN